MLLPTTCTRRKGWCTRLAAFAWSVAGLMPGAFGANGTWGNPAAVSTAALTSTSGSSNLTWIGSAFAVGQEVRLTTTVPGGFSRNTNYFVVFASGTTIRLATSAGGTAINATSTISNGTAQACQSWQTAANWSGGTVAGGTDAIATFANAPVSNVPAITLDGNVTVGKLSFTNTTGSASDMSLISGSSSANTLTFAVSSGTPVIEMPGAVARLLNLGGTDVLKVAGTQGLLVRSSAGGALTGAGLAATGSEPAKNTRVTNVDWSGFSGGITVERGYLQPNAPNQLPVQGLTIGDDQSAADGVLAGLVASTAQSIDALNGNGSGRVQGTFTLTVGANGGGGDFGGILGQSFSGTATATSLVKTGGGTQTLSGAMKGTGSVTVNGGTLLVDGTHMQGTGANAGAYVVASDRATLGGTGTIALSDTNGSGTGITISGTLAPGDPAEGSSIGTLTIDGASSARGVLTFATGGAVTADLGVSFACDTVAVVNGQANDVVFNNTTINFHDTTGGVLYAGRYVLFSGDGGTTYKNLVTGANGAITSGLAIGTGLGGYPGSQLKVVGNNIVLDLVSPYSPPAAPLDSLMFGDAAAESAHGLVATGSVLDTNGGLGQTCRRVMPDTFLTFKLAVNPAAKNYLTVKLWGSETNTNTLYLYKVGSTTSLPSSNHYGFYNNYNTGGYPDILPPIYFNFDGAKPFPDRFYYVTFLIPSELIDAGTSTATIQLGEVGALSPYAAAGSQEGAPTTQSVGVYGVYSGTDPYFANSAGEAQGTAPAGLTSSPAASVSSVISTLQGSLNSTINTVAGWQIYGSSWNGVTSTGSGGASFSPIGSIYKGSNSGSPPTLDAIATQMSGGNAVNLRIPSYLAKAYVTSWSSHYHDTTYLDRVVKALDFCCLMQGSNGGLSTYNGSGTTWVGAPNRTAGGNPLEGYGTQGLGLAFVLIYAEAQKDAATNTLLQSYLSSSISDGVNTLPRAQAWANMFNNNVAYLTSTGRGHATNQDLAQMTAMWLENQASQQLGSANALSTAAALQYVYSATGLAPSPLSATPSQAGFWFSPKGLPLEPWGTLGGGYDGNYGLGNGVSEIVYLAELTGDPAIIQQAQNAVNTGAQFLSPSIDDAGTKSWRKEETISTRTLEWPGRVDFLNDGSPYAASPAGLNNAIAQRFTQIAYQSGDVITILPSSNAHYVDSVGYALLNMDSYAAALLAPATSARIPTESGQPDFAWADPEGCTVVAQQTTPGGDTSRLYMELQWRRGFSSSSVRNLSTAQVNNIARVHFTTPTIDRVATIGMDTVGGFGGLYTCRYGPYFVAMNLNATGSAACTMPADLWGKVGKNLVTQAAFTVPANGVINVTNAAPLVFTPTAGPVVISTSATVAAAGTTGDLSVAAADNTGTSGLTYTWSVAGTPPAPVSFSGNGTNGAANTTATFGKAGVYDLAVTVTDPASLSATGHVSVTVDQVLTSIAVSPSPGSVNAGETLQFTAVAQDQFGDPMNAQPTFAWSISSGDGTITSGGLYTAPAAVGSAVVQALGGAIAGLATVNVVSPPFSDGETEGASISMTGGTIKLGVKTSIVGHTYTVQFCTDLVAADWQELTNVPAQSGTGGALEFLVPANASGPREFYRIHIQR